MTYPIPSALFNDSPKTTYTPPPCGYGPIASKQFGVWHISLTLTTEGIYRVRVTKAHHPLPTELSRRDAEIIEDAIQEYEALVKDYHQIWCNQFKG